MALIFHNTIKNAKKAGKDIMDTIFKYLRKVPYTLGLAISITGLVSCTSGNSKNADNSEGLKAIELPVTTVNKTIAFTEKTYLGSVEGTNNVEIRPQVGGKLKAIFVDEGEYVEKGQKLFQIDPLTYNEALNNEIANREVRKAELEKAALEIERLTPLVENEVISDVRLRAAESNYEVAKSALAQSNAAVNSAKINRDFTLIKAPVDGYIGRIPKRIGNIVSMSDSEPMTVLSDIKNVRVYFSMSETDFLYFNERSHRDSSAVEEGETKDILTEVSLILADGKEFEEKGIIDAVDGHVNRNTGAISLRATFPNPKGMLRSGNSGKIKLEERHQNVIVIPQTAIYEIMDKTFVYVLQEDNIIKRHPVMLAGKSGKNYLVKEGLEAGDKIVTSGVESLNEGMMVIPQK